MPSLEAYPVIEPPDAVILAHQRSGTHFLQASLSSHPQIHTRDECLMHLRAALGGAAECREAQFVKYDIRNRAGAVNVAIVMYSQLSLALRAWGGLGGGVKVIHLLRSPRDVAVSFAQMNADKQHLLSSYRPHYRIGETPHRPCPVIDVDVLALERSMACQQEEFRTIMRQHPKVLELRYEELTRGIQTNRILPDRAAEILRFLGLETRDLENDMLKTGSAGLTNMAARIP